MPLLLSQLENSPGPVPPGKAGSDGTGAGVSMDAARGRLKALFPGDFPDQVPRSQTVFSSRGSPAETPARSNPDPSHHGCRVSSSPARGRSRSPEVLPRSPSNQSFGLGTSPARGRPRSPVRSRSPVRGGKVRAIHGMVLPARADNGKLSSLLLAEPGSSTDSASSTMAKGPDSSYLRQYPEHPMSRLVQVDPSAESLKDVSTHSTGSEGKVSISGRTLTRNNSYGSFAAWAGQHAERVKHAVVKKGSRLMSVTNNATSSEEIFKKRLHVLGTMLIACALYGALLFSIGPSAMFFGDEGKGWALFLIWVSSTFGGAVFAKLGAPTLLGMLTSGILLSNVIEGGLVYMLPESWSATIRAFGLCVILMRSGLEMDVSAVKKIGMVAVRLTCMPGICEALAVAGAASWIFGMPFALAVSAGFILAAVSPAVVVVGMFNLQQRGYGVAKGIPSLVVAAASFDDVVAISGFSMCIGLAVGHGSLLMNALHGPINLVAGIFAGVVGGTIASFTQIWDKRWKRTGILLLQGVIFTFLAKNYHYAGAGALASLVMAVVAAQNWLKGTPNCFGLTAGVQERFAHQVEVDLARVWVLLAQPLLFGVIGTALDFRKLPPSTIPKAILVTFMGVCIRTIVAFFSTLGIGLSVKERLFIALAWIPKATVQAALAAVPLDMVLSSMTAADPLYEEYVTWGKDILTTAVFSIILTAPIGLVVIAQLGPAWLSNDAQDVHEESHSHGKAERGEGKLAASDDVFAPDDGLAASGEMKGNLSAAAVEPGSEHQIRLMEATATAFVQEQFELLGALAAKLEKGHIKSDTAALDLRKRSKRLEEGVNMIKTSLERSQRAHLEAMQADRRDFTGDDDDKMVDTAMNFFRLVNQATAFSADDTVSETNSTDVWGRTQSV